MTVLLLITKFIQEYQGYRRDCKREDDLLVKKKLIDELTALRSMLTQFTNEKDNSTSLNKEVKPVKNHIDEFIQEIEYSLSGHSYPFFSPQSSVGVRHLKKIMKYDLSLLEKTTQLRSHFEKFQHSSSDADEQSLIADLRQICQKITETKNDFQRRKNLIKKIS